MAAETLRLNKVVLDISFYRNVYKPVSRLASTLGWSAKLLLVHSPDIFSRISRNLTFVLNICIKVCRNFAANVFRVE